MGAVSGEEHLSQSLAVPYTLRPFESSGILDVTH